MSAWRHGIRRHTVFMMVLSLFFVIVIPIYILGFGIYQWGYRMMSQQIANSLQADVSYYQNILEGELRRIRDLQYECLNDEDLFYTINAESIMTPYARAKALLAMQHRLSVMQNSSEYIDDVQVYIPAANRMISATEGVNPLTDEWRRIIFTPKDASASGLTYAGDQLYLCASYPILSPDPEATPLFVMVLRLSTQAMLDNLMSYNLYEGGGTALINTAQGFILTGGAAGSLSLRISESEADFAVLKSGGTALISHGGERFFTVGHYSDYMNALCYAYVPEQTIYGGIWHYRTLFIIFSVVVLGVAVCFSFGSYWLIRRPMKRLVNSLKTLEKGDLSVRIQHNINDEYAYLYDTFNSMAAALENLFETNYKQQLLTQQAEMRHLQAQINPHFLYNSFFTLYRMATDEDYENTTKFLVYLSDFYRFITRDAHSRVMLKDEVQHAANYANIQQFRFAKRLTVRMDELPKALETIMVPRLILQPVLENAFGHGLKDVVSEGLLSVAYEQEAPFVRIRVENNGPALSAGEIAAMSERLDSASGLNEITGLVNIHRRLKMMFGEGCGLTIQPGAQGGLLVTLTLRSDGAPNDREEDAYVPHTGG